RPGTTGACACGGGPHPPGPPPPLRRRGGRTAEMLTEGGREGGLCAVVAAPSGAGVILPRAPMREGAAPGGPRRVGLRLGAVRHGGIVPYRARSPARSAQSYRARRDTPKPAVRSPWVAARRSADGEDEAGDAPPGARPVLQGEHAAVVLRDLAGEHQPDPRAAGLGGEEGDEEV